MGKKIDYGCGYNLKDGYLGLNYPETEETDIVHDITKFPHPFSDNEVEAIYCDNVLEHFSKPEIKEIMREWARICEEGAIIEIKVPHFNHWNAKAFNHKTSFSKVSFDCFDVDHEYPVSNTNQRFKVEKIERRWIPSLWMRALRTIFPDSLLYHLFTGGVSEIYFRLRVVK